jgi:hypothetical protein
MFLKKLKGGIVKPQIITGCAFNDVIGGIQVAVPFK